MSSECQPSPEEIRAVAYELWREHIFLGEKLASFWGEAERGLKERCQQADKTA